MKIPAWISYVFKIVLFLFSLLTLVASTGPQYVGGSAAAAAIIFWAAVATTGITGIYTILGTGNVPSITTLGKVQSFILACVAGLVVLALLAPGEASAKTRRPTPTPPRRPISATSPTVITNDILLKISTAVANLKAKGLDDIGKALTLAQNPDPNTKQPNDPLAASCYPALTTFVNNLPALPTSIDNVGPFQLFEMKRQVVRFVNAGVPDYIQLACAGLVGDELKTLAVFLTDIGVGASAIPTGGLTLPAFAL